MNRPQHVPTHHREQTGRAAVLIGAHIILAVALVLSGCAAQAPPQTPASPEMADKLHPLPAVSIDGYADVTATLDYTHAGVSLPMDEYSADSASYVSTVLQAINALTDRCMTAKGHPANSDDLNRPYVQEDRLFGLWSTEFAAKYGTDPAPEGEAKEIDLTAYDSGYAIDYSACKDTARQSLSEPLAQLDVKALVGLDVRIRNTATELVLTSNAGQTAKGDWETCMTTRGLVLEDRDGRPAASYRDHGQSEVIRVTVIEAECARTTGAVQRLYDLQARYESAFIDAEQSELDNLLEERTAIRTDLESAIAGG